MTKPIGPICNIDCKYCFYLEKEELYPDTRKWAMPEPVLENYIRQYIQQQDIPEISFAWQGGEPTLLGVRFFRKVVELQRRYADGKSITNAFQTNGTLLDDQWGEFLSAEKFLVGLSIDGPRELHDAYRVDKKGEGTFDQVMRGLAVLQKHRVEFNTLTVVNAANSRKPLEVYGFLRDIGSTFIQFIPLVERAAALQASGLSLPVPLTVNGRAVEQTVRHHPHALADPPLLHDRIIAPVPVTEWSVDPLLYGEFLCRIFDQWVRRDVGKTFVQLFDVALGIWAGAGSSLCLFTEKCGSALAMEHNGDLYSCDHFVYPRYRLGNIADAHLGEMALSPRQQAFGSDKADTLPRYCRSCDVRFACNGECPKHRFSLTPDGEPGLNYLCPAYKRFFRHIDPYMKTMAALLRAQRAPAMIMDMLAAESSRGAQQKPRPLSGAADRRTPRAANPPGRNDPCPCGSGRKYKKCCGA